MLASMAECEQTRTLLRAKIQQFPDIHAVSAEILALRGGEGEKNGKKNMYAKSCLNSRPGPDRCHASPDYPTELFSISRIMG